MIYISKVRELLSASTVGSDQVSTEAFDTFFGGKRTDHLITQDKFSSLMREHELRLVGGAFQITDLEG